MNKLPFNEVLNKTNLSRRLLLLPDCLALDNTHTHIYLCVCMYVYTHTHTHIF